jgi:hypothetical protein
MPENPASSIDKDVPAVRLSPLAAQLILAALALALVALVAVSFGIGPIVRRPGVSDLDTYERVIAALKAGQAYYPALHQALLDGGYGTLSPLNWRPPLFLTALSWFPSLMAAQWTLGVLTAGAWGLAVAFASRKGGLGIAIATAVIMAASLLSIAAPRAELSFELCAGMLILISVSANGLGWRWLGFAAAVLALFVRELAILYIFVCLIDAMRRKDRREVIAWLLCLGAYGAFYQWHMQQVAALLGPADHAAATGWLQFGGLGFVLRSAAFNGVLLVAPYWVAAIVLVLGLTGLRRVPVALATVLLYLVLFSIYGRPENEYWGAVYTPLVALGLAWAPAVLGTLIARSRRSSSA